MSYPFQMPPPPPRRRLDRGKLIAFSFLGVLVLLGGISVAAGALDSHGTAAPGTSSSAPAKPAKGDDKPAPKEKPEPKPASEAGDLVSIQLDDRSEYGIPDIWVTYTVKNNSSKASDYLIKYEVVDSSGTRADNGELYVTNLQPGQETNEEMFTLLETVEGMKLNVTEVDRTEAW